MTVENPIEIDPPCYLSQNDVLCRCKTPYYAECQRCAGCLNVLIPGCGLYAGACCCLGECCQRGACQIACAGLYMFLFAPLLVGWGLSVVVGVRMMLQ
ncbi:Cysteine-rich membrane protein 2 [Spironucleus salmonicida]|uniref:Cysteine-rich membrane protein 2 n=1 Tax=Spironucleus salmonicida TaxID=348837 RepID=V6LTD3_9EUKA|nr:Cysteine-rich membrane protein 2 [Spironucleus salmonicida]KAH0571739.1 Cysteine-rich membrane protein 2 [Spironucleus salmonicida]|eukprot:EST47840.1 Cysteine-rich membrane protein 2 [Spironucleus salmonicida]